MPDNAGYPRADLVCVPGWGLSAGIWDGLIQRAQRHLVCHTPDLPGHGRNSSGNGRDEATGLNNWVDAIVERSPPQAIYLGWSLGGLLGLQIARRYPARVRGLILISALPRMRQGAGWRWGWSMSDIRDAASQLSVDRLAAVQELVIQQLLGEPGARHLLRQLRNQMLSAPPTAKGLQRGLDILADTDLRDDMSGLDLPVLLVGGERDRICPPQAIRWMAEQLPDSRLWTVPRAAHAPFVTHEREFADRVAEFALSLKPIS